MRSAYAEKISIPGINHAGRINDNLYRGAQPKNQGFSELKKLGITTVIDLRGEDRQAVDWERQQVESLGMRFVTIPVGGMSAPTDQQVVQFLSLLRDQPHHKVFVHCYYGEDRTGVFVASYRMALEKWPAAQALKEMYLFGFHGFWQRSMKAFVRDFPARLTSAPAYTRLNDLGPLPIMTPN
jgi:tyrosine-protein phosphatase SIW14